MPSFIFTFTKKEFRKQGATVIKCGNHLAVIYKHQGRWALRSGFQGASDFIPSNQYSEQFGIASKSAAIVQAEAAIVGWGPYGVDYLDCSIEYKKGATSNV
jgi:hypothetical protein